MLRHRRGTGKEPTAMTTEDAQRSVQDERGGAAPRRARWIALSLASGACAAFNGAFAKLTTTHLTSSIAAAIAHRLGLSNSKALDLTIRATFFALNLTFNAIVHTSHAGPSIPDKS
ncbi:transcription initiation factor IIA small subunit [Ophiocordyceps camponoti-floridani]|uniref:Transcription initiation factor IIA small subunit n=1 Tax=Ophiocordyceps camponoti-floridani TaxID=2030778 RepID=A0A8H4VDI2_9HYPO|nr:transcription initiation factor IIA small subunit [Ophiocordyceps camponoti-floridani]